MAAFENFVDWLIDMGVVDVLLPFLLIFAIIFAIMEKTKILGDERRQIHVVISLIISAIVVIPHVIGAYPSGADPIEIINRALPSVSLVLVAVIALLLLMGVFGQEWPGLHTAVFLFALIAVLWIFGSAAGWWGNWDWIRVNIGEDAIAIVVVILVFAVLIWWITKPEEKTAGEGFLRGIGDWFKPKGK